MDPFETLAHWVRAAAAKCLSSHCEVCGACSSWRRLWICRGAGQNRHCQPSIFRFVDPVPLRTCTGSCHPPLLPPSCPFSLFLLPFPFLVLLFPVTFPLRSSLRAIRSACPFPFHFASHSSFHLPHPLFFSTNLCAILGAGTDVDRGSHSATHACAGAVCIAFEGSSKRTH